MSEHDKRNLPSIPPPITGYWAWVREELKVKADEKWVISELKSLKRMFDDTKVTATDARKRAERPYVCNKEIEIEDLKKWQYKVTNWKIPVIISIVILVISAAGQYFSLKDSVEDGNQSREQIQVSLESINKKQTETSEIVSELKMQVYADKKERKVDLEDFAERIASKIKADISQGKHSRKREQ